MAKCKIHNRGIVLTNEIIQEKSRSLQRTINLGLPHAKLISKTFSKGRFHRFKQRYGVWCNKLHGEVGDADHASAATALPHQRKIGSRYALCDIFNADAFYLYYSASLNTKIGPGPLRRRKQSKRWVTFLACTSLDGTERLPPLMVQTDMRP